VVAALIDTSIVIDILRSYQPAVNWLQGQTEEIGITRFVWYEVIEGSSDKHQQHAAIRVLDKFRLIPITNEDVEWATVALLQHYLKSNTDALDCLIAATAHRLQNPLYTRNLKHFRPLLGDLAQQPY
jgi:predicted nucleic acid-binding protein